MLRRLCSKIVTVDQSMLPVPALLRCSRVNCSTIDESDNDEQQQRATSSAPSFCHVQMLGRVGSTPREIEGQKGSFVTLPLCVNVPTKDKRVNYHQVNVNKESTKNWLMNYVKTGDTLFVTGQLTYQLQDNRKFYQVFAETVSMVNRARPRDSEAQDEDVQREEQ